MVASYLLARSEYLGIHVLFVVSCHQFVLEGRYRPVRGQPRSAGHSTGGAHPGRSGRGGQASFDSYGLTRSSRRVSIGNVPIW